MRVFLTTLFIGLCVVACQSVRPRALDSECVEIAPAEDADAVLHNPDMGWLLYENYPLDQSPGGSSSLVVLPNENFNAVDEVAIMFAWSDIETRDGVFDFSKADFAYDYWKARGKKMQLRMCTESLLWWTNASPPSGLGVPPHVLAEMPAEHQQTRKLEGISYVVVDARDAIYLRRLERFLHEVAKHFDARRPVRMIDLRGFGVWGEWHSGFKYESIEVRRAALCDVIDRWSDAFPDQYLSLSGSYDPDSPREYYEGPTDRFDPAFTGHYKEFMHYSAFDYAMTKPNITLRRDGVGGAVHSNERKLNDDAFNTLTKGPMTSEFLGGYGDGKKAGDKWLRFMIDDALSLHPNYINLLGYGGSDAQAFIRERPDLIEHGLRNMGYRLVPTSIRYPRTVGSQEKFNVEMTWINRGVGRAMIDAVLRIDVVSKKDPGRRGTFGSVHTSQWIKGHEYHVSRTLDIADLPSGKYTLLLSLIDPRTNQRIALPLKDGDAANGYRFGEIECGR